MEKPDVENIEGLSPAISIDQKTTSRNPRSTVGTVTEIYDYLRLLFARIGIPHCHVCGREITQQTVDQMVDRVLELETGTRIQLLAPVVRERKGEYHKLIEDIRKGGYVRIRVDGIVYDINDDIALDRYKKHSIEIVVDRLVVKPDIRKRLADSLETVLNLSSGLALVDIVGGNELLFSQNLACPECGVSIEELTPRMFSFNSPFGACPECTGLGGLLDVDEDLVIPDRSKSLAEGAIQVAGWNVENGETYASATIKALAQKYGFSMNTPVRELPRRVMDIILYGTGSERITVQHDREYGGGFIPQPSRV